MGLPRDVTLPSFARVHPFSFRAGPRASEPAHGPEVDRCAETPARIDVIDAATRAAAASQRRGGDLIRRLRFVALALGTLVVAHTGTAQARGAVRGVAYDSLAGAPLAGATIQIGPAQDVAQARTTVADSLGRFRFDSLPAGRWIAVVMHPSIDALAIDPPTRLVDVRDGTATAVTLGPPSGAAMLGALCPDATTRVADDSSGALLGIVRDADTGRPLDAGSVSLAWNEIALAGGLRTVVRRVTASVRPGGLFLFCGAPSDADLTLRAEAPGLASGDVAAAARAHGVVRRDLAVGARVATDTSGLAPRVPSGARLVASIVDDRGRPLAHAHVLVLGVEADAAAGESGLASLDALPSGSWTVEARAVGYAPTRAAVVLARDEPARVTLSLRRAATLDRVVVRGKAPTNPVLGEFLARRQRGMGTFLTPADIERKRPLEPTDVLQGIPGLLVQAAGTGTGHQVRGRAGCMPTVFIDGFAIQGAAANLAEVISVNDIRAVEVYPGAMAPAQYNSHRVDGCEVILLWTRV